jgi:hypothetical protein
MAGIDLQDKTKSANKGLTKKPEDCVYSMKRRMRRTRLSKAVGLIIPHFAES